MTERINRKQNGAPTVDPTGAEGAAGSQWKGQLKHKMRGMNYADAATRLSPRTGMPAPATSGPTTGDNAAQKPFDTADPELREKHQNKPEYKYQRFSGQLFLNGVSATDVQQGSIADCYLGAALAAVANTNPKCITDMIKDEGNGKYKVRFFKTSYFGKPKSEWITVDGDLPASGGDQLYTRGVDKDAKNQREMWPGIVEKAYAQWKGGYDDIGEGGYSGDVLTAITGESSKSRTLSTMKPDALWTELTKAIDAGQPVTCGTHGKDAVDKDKDLKKKYDEAKVYPWHAYTVISYSEKKTGNETERFVKVRNPWGKAHGGSSYSDKGIFELKYDLWKTVYSSIVINGKKAK